VHALCLRIDGARAAPGELRSTGECYDAVVSSSGPRYVVDPEDPRAPPAEVWASMSEEERDAVVASLPSEWDDASPPEGDPHFNAKVGAREALGNFFAKIGRRVYLACEMGVYYPGEPAFAPDLMAVLDVELKERMSWVVSREGKGIDLAMEIHVAGDRRKDIERNVERFARLGIHEYFIFDRGRLRLTGFRLRPGGGYAPIVPQAGRYPSTVLGLDIAIDSNKLRFFHGTAPLAESSELVARLEGMLDGLEARAAESEARAAESEARAAESEARRQDAERRLAEALAEIERLKSGG